MIPLFDLHCDTLLEIYEKKENIKENSLHVSLNKVQNFLVYLQIGAIWSDYKLTNDEAYFRCLEVIDYAKSQNINFSTNLDRINKNNFILAIEDARLLNNHIERLDTLFSHGVRVITLNWKNNSCIGGGWNTSSPLTVFGKDVVLRAYELGITVDVSHSSVETFWDVIKICENLGFSPIASHSNAYTICNHKRNLNDNQIKVMCNLKGVIGISLVPEHIGSNANTDSILKHIEHFLNLGCEYSLCLGCDFDGTGSLPYGFNSIEDLLSLFYIVENKFGNKIAKRIFFENAYRFFKKNL